MRVRRVIMIVMMRRWGGDESLDHLGYWMIDDDKQTGDQLSGGREGRECQCSFMPCTALRKARTGRGGIVQGDAHPVGIYTRQMEWH